MTANITNNSQTDKEKAKNDEKIWIIPRFCVYLHGLYK
jgi:hypothetical protein